MVIWHRQDCCAKESTPVILNFGAEPTISVPSTSPRVALVSVIINSEGCRHSLALLHPSPRLYACPLSVPVTMKKPTVVVANRFRLSYFAVTNTESS
jgi:hypothetical protein